MVLFPSQYLVTFSSLFVLNTLVPPNHMMGLILTRVPSIILTPTLDLKGKKKSAFWPGICDLHPSLVKNIDFIFSSDFAASVEDVQNCVHGWKFSLIVR